MGFPELRALEYAGIGNYKRLGSFRGIFHMSNMGDLQTLELTEHWKFGRREVLEVPL